MKQVLTAIIKTMENVYSIDVSMYAESFMKLTIQSRCKAVNIESFQDYIVYLSNNKKEAYFLKKELANSYTVFFRDSIIFANLEKWILPKLIEDKSNTAELRMWSAGWSSGQEPYSIAMLIDDYFSQKKQLRYRIIATDKSQTELEIAKKGEYTENAIQNIKMKYINDYFIEIEGTYKICSRIKERISFSIYDMLDKELSYPQESIFGNFDIVICSNLLFYYRPEHQRYILKKLIHSMSDKGYLILGETEREMEIGRASCRERG